MILAQRWWGLPPRSPPNCGATPTWALNISSCALRISRRPRAWNSLAAKLFPSSISRKPLTQPQTRMDNQALARFKVVRLNAALYPVNAHEAGLYRQHGLRPVEVEANSPADLVGHLHDCDALFVVSEPLPAAVIKQLARCRVISRLGLGTDKI